MGKLETGGSANYAKDMYVCQWVDLQTPSDVCTRASCLYMCGLSMFLRCFLNQHIDDYDWFC